VVESLGDSEAALHAHVFPRYLSEPEEKRTKPAWFYDWKTAPKFDPAADRGLQDEIRNLLIKKYQQIGMM
jgi:hypothetical protein